MNSLQRENYMNERHNDPLPTLGEKTPRSNSKAYTHVIA